MPDPNDPIPSSTEAGDAAKILRGLKERVDRLEESDSTPDGVNVLRNVGPETTDASDSVSVSTSAAGSGTFDVDDFGFAEFA